MKMLHEFRGRSYTLKDLAQMSGIASNTLQKRLYRGWSIEQAMCIPSSKQIKRGVVMNFPPVLGTGAGGFAQEIHKISFSNQEHSK